MSPGRPNTFETMDARSFVRSLCGVTARFAKHRIKAIRAIFFALGDCPVCEYVLLVR